MHGETGLSEGMILLDELALDLVHLVVELTISKAIVVGLSMGGQVALEMCRLCPGLFNGIVLADTDARAYDEQGYQNRLALSVKILNDGMEKFTEERIHHFMCPGTFANKPDVSLRVVNMMKTTSPTGSAAVQRGRAARPDYTPLLGKIDFPALVIVGDQDEFSPLASSTYIYERIKNATLVVISNSGHIANMEQPADFNKALEMFLDTKFDLSSNDTSFYNDLLVGQDS